MRWQTPHDKAHIMLNQQDSQVEMVAEPADHFHEFLRFLRIHARRRFIKKQQLRFRRKRPCNFKAALGPIGKVFARS